MAFGQKQFAIALPQPGTSNTPFPVTVRTGGGFLGLFPRYKVLPAFTPVRFSVAEQNAAAVKALTSQLSALFASVTTQVGTANTPGTVLAALAEINENLARIADQKAAIVSDLNNLIIAVGTCTTNINAQNQIASTKLTNQIQFNNFFKQYNGETPELPEFKEQLTQSVKDGILLNDQSSKVGFFDKTIRSTLNSAAQWITGTEIYQTVGKYLNKIKDSIMAVVPTSLKSAASNAKAGRVGP